MRPIQKTLIDFNQIDAYMKNVQLLGNHQTANALQNAKRDILFTFDKQASNYSVLLVTYDDKHTAVKVVPRDFWL